MRCSVVDVVCVYSRWLFFEWWAFIHNAQMICDARFNRSGDRCEDCALRSGRALCVAGMRLRSLRRISFNEKHSERYFF